MEYAEDSDAHIYSKEEVIQNFVDDLEEISDTESVESGDDKTVHTENSEKMKKLLRSSRPKDECYVKYYTLRGKKNIKIECYGTIQNVGNYIRCPYSGIRGNDKIGSRNENLYFKAVLPCVSKGDISMAFYYDTPEAFERHHLVVLSPEIKNKFYERRK